MKRILLCGYYGFDNLGDELILRSLAEGFRNEEVWVLSVDPHATRTRHKVRTVSRWNPWAVFRAMGRSDRVVIGGGGLFQDATSSLSLYYYLALMALARLRGRNLVVRGVGIGPIWRSWNQRLTAWFMNRVESLSVRDSESAALLRQWGVTRPIFVEEDEVMGLTLPEPVTAHPKRLAALLRRPRNPPPGFAAVLKQELERLARSGWDILLIPFHKAQDSALAEELRLPYRSCLWSTEEEALAALSSCSAVLTMRFHGAVLAHRLGKPCLALSEDEKTAAFLKAHPGGTLIPLELLAPGVLTQAMRSFEPVFSKA